MPYKSPSLTRLPSPWTKVDPKYGNHLLIGTKTTESWKKEKKKKGSISIIVEDKMKYDIFFPDGGNIEQSISICLGLIVGSIWIKSTRWWSSAMVLWSELKYLRTEQHLIYKYNNVSKQIIKQVYNILKKIDLICLD